MAVSGQRVNPEMAPGLVAEFGSSLEDRGTGPYSSGVYMCVGEAHTQPRPILHVNGKLNRLIAFEFGSFY